MTDREIIRDLAGRVRAFADDQATQQKRELWRQHNALQGDRPMVLCSPEGGWGDLLPHSALQCKDDHYRGWEWGLRAKLCMLEELRDDSFVDPFWDVGWHVNYGNYGFDVPMTYGDNRGSYVWEAPIKDPESELSKLHFRPLSVDRESTRREFDLVQEVFGDLLPPRIRSSMPWTLGMTWEAAKLVGLENLMFMMCDQPEQIHRLMAFLRDEHMNLINWMETEGLLTPNSEADGVGSGGIGCTDQLHPSAASGVKLSDRWGFAESQETVGISPTMFEEFVLPYQIPLMDKFGLNCYGCCEGLENRIDQILKNIPRLRRISVAPSANQEIMAAALGGRYIYSRKPYPAHVCVGFNEPAIREDLRHTLTVARGQPLELILKDTHTVQGEPWRFKRWVEIAREEVERSNWS